MDEHFTEREMTIINEFIKGKSNIEIAQALYVSRATVKFYMTEILRKTKCQNRVHLLIYLFSNPEGIALKSQAENYVRNLVK